MRNVSEGQNGQMMTQNLRTSSPPHLLLAYFKTPGCNLDVAVENGGDRDETLK